MNCTEKFYRPGDDWHQASCERPAKFRATHGITNRFLCGVHVRRYRRLLSWVVSPWPVETK